MASPVEDYFLLIDELEEPARAECVAVTAPLLDALDTAYDIPAEGTGFYALQSCANHSCDPSAHTLKVPAASLAALDHRTIMLCRALLERAFAVAVTDIARIACREPTCSSRPGLAVQQSLWSNAGQQ